MYAKKIKAVIDLIEKKLKSKLKESELNELKVKTEAIQKTLQTFKETLEPIAKKIKAQQAIPIKTAQPQTGISKLPIAKTAIPITPSGNSALDRLKSNPVPRNSQHSAEISKTKKNEEKAQKETEKTGKSVGTKDQTWKSENVTETQLKARYFSRKEKSIEKIHEIKKKIFNLKVRKFEMIWDSLPKFMPKNLDKMPVKIREEVLKSFEEYYKKQLAVSNVVDMNTRTKFFTQAFMGSEVSW